MIKPHEIVALVTSRVKGLTDPAYRELGKDAGCFSATRDGKRSSLTVSLDMLPSFNNGWIFMPATWTEKAIALYVIKQLEPKT